MMKNAFSFVLLLLMVSIADYAIGGQKLPLRVDWGGVSLDEPFPVTGGVPFARGELKDPAALRLISGGQELPLQKEVLARWPDRSVKWLLLDFLALPAQQSFELEYGEDVHAVSAAPVMLKATATENSVRVDTGVIQFAIRNDGSGFIDELSYKANEIPSASGRRLNLMDAIHTNSPGDYSPMNRYVKDGKPDPSQVIIKSISLEKSGPLHAVVLIDGVYHYKLVGSTIEGTDVKGDCPFRLRLHAYANQPFIRIEHFFYYEGDADHDFIRSLALKIPLPPQAKTIRFIASDRIYPANGPISGLYQQTPDAFEIWSSDGRTLGDPVRGRRFEGVLDVTGADVGIALWAKDFWQNAAKGLQADLNAGEAGIYFWPPEAPPLDFRRHAREWSCGETGSPDDPNNDVPVPYERGNYRLASKGVGKTHYALLHLHDASASPQQLLNVAKLFEHRPLLWASPHHYASTLALGAYREYVPGEHEAIEKALDAPARYWRDSQEKFRWYGFWIYGNVGQVYNAYVMNGRWPVDFGRWGWANGDSVGRLAQALMLQSLRKTQREDLEFAEKYLYAVHDVCSTHTPAYPHHYSNNFAYLKGAAHRHGAWPWAGVYVGIRGAHPVGAKIYYFLTGEGHVKDVLDEITQLALKNADGGEGDGPLGPNAQIFLYQWETTGDEQWAGRVKAEIEGAKLDTLSGGWNVMMSAAFGMYNALEEYMDLSGDRSLAPLARKFADEAMPAKMKKHWTWGGYYRVYAAAWNLTGEEKYRKAIEEMLPVFLHNAEAAASGKLPEKDWPGLPGGPGTFVDANITRDVPYALYALHNPPAGKEGR